MLEQFISLYSQVEVFSITLVKSLVATYGAWGVLVGMFFESSIIPIPSELVLVSAGALGIDLWQVAIFATIGSTLGSIVGYYIGLKGGRPIVDKIGPYLFITKEKVDRAELKFKKVGGPAIFFFRLIPFVPFKVFSITSGILKFDFKQFVIYTFIGTIPRAFILAWIGSEIIKYKTQAYGAIAVLVALAVVYYFFNKWVEKRNAHKLA